MGLNILVLNVGSSSLKSRLYEIDGVATDAACAPLWDLRVDWSEPDRPGRVEIRTHFGANESREIPPGAFREHFLDFIQTLWSGDTRVINDKSEIDAVGHRVVHGGNTFRESVRITPQVAERIEELSEFAPSHNPIEFDVIEAMEWLLGREVPQVAVFDTAFHATMPPVAYVYGGPYEWVEEGIRRYGFHGISYQYVSRRAAQVLGKELASLRMVACHLGNGCSLAAIKGGRSVDTTMGFTPLDGLVMGTRSGSVDPGILIYLLRHGRADADRLDKILNRDSGLKGISGISPDMRQIVSEMKAGNERARLAFDVFVRRTQKGICSMLPSLGGLDALVFPAGIGENSPDARRAICDGLAPAGVRLDAQKNLGATSDRDISAADSAVRVLVIQTEEDWQVAQECLRLVPTQARGT